MKVTILGAGIIGVSSAWFLRQAGFEVTVIDRQPEPALETSFANGGQLSVSQSEPWAGPETPLRLLKWLWRDDSPLLFRPHMDLQQWLWGLRFLGECTPAAVRRNMRQMVNLGLFSRHTLQALRRETGIEYAQSAKGILQIYFDPREFDNAVAAAGFIRQHGCHRVPVSPEQAVVLEPALGHLQRRLAGATYAEDDESGDAHLFTQRLAALAASAGVEFQFNTCVRGFETSKDCITGVRTTCGEGKPHIVKSDLFLVCLGSYSTPMLAPLGIHLPIYPAKGYSATLATAGYEGAPTVSITDDAVKMVFSRLGDRIRIAGTAELNGYSTELNEVRCEALTRRYFSLFPHSADPNSVKYWTGLRPSTPSNVPLIGRLTYRNLYLNAGHGTLGWTEGPGSGRAIAELIGGNRPDIGFDFIDWYQG